MFTYEQATGRLLDPSGNLLGQGYAGHGAGVNNPSMQGVAEMGPLPRGKYKIGEPYTNPHTGRVTMNLEPDAANQMFGRGLFRIHGDNPLGNRSASEGCIVVPLGVRMAIARAIGYRIDPQDYSVTAIPPEKDNTLLVVA